MIESIFGGILGFAAVYLLTWPALIALVIFGILFEHNEWRGWAVFTAITVAAVSFFFFHVPLVQIAEWAVVYLVVGLVWSFYRYKRFAEAAVAGAIERNYSDGDKRRLAERLHPMKMVSTITAWIIVWPFSFVDNFIGDLINAVQNLVRKVFRGVYVKIYESAIAALKV